MQVPRMSLNQSFKYRVCHLCVVTFNLAYPVKWLTLKKCPVRKHRINLSEGTFKEWETLLYTPGCFWACPGDRQFLVYMARVVYMGSAECRNNFKQQMPQTTKAQPSAAPHRGASRPCGVVVCAFFAGNSPEPIYTTLAIYTRN